MGQNFSTLKPPNNTLQQTNASLLHEINVICVDLTKECDDFANECHYLDSAEDEINHLHGVESNNKKTINDLNTEVNLLKAQLEEQDQLNPPCKLPCYS